MMKKQPTAIKPHNRTAGGAFGAPPGGGLLPPAAAIKMPPERIFGYFAPCARKTPANRRNASAPGAERFEPAKKGIALMQRFEFRKRLEPAKKKKHCFEAVL